MSTSQYIVLSDPASSHSGDVFEGVNQGNVGVAAAAEPADPQADIVDLSKNDVVDLARDRDVIGFAPTIPTRLVEPFDGDSASALSDNATWGVEAIGATSTSFDGDGVTVSVLDTGIDAEHPAFAGVELIQKDFSGSGNGDRQGHGTHCAGTVFGRDVDNTRIGVATGVKKALIGKVLGDNGRGGTQMIADAMLWANRNGASILSMSLGMDFQELVRSLTEDQGMPLDLATSRALQDYRANVKLFDILANLISQSGVVAGGATIIAAAGNSSKRTPQNPDHEIFVAPPAVADRIVSVGAVGTSGAPHDNLTIAPFSNTAPNIAGPGVDVSSAKVGGGLRTISGTSMATPHVAGAAALWIQEITQATGRASLSEIRARLIGTTVRSRFADSVDSIDVGSGFVQVPQ